MPCKPVRERQEPRPFARVPSRMYVKLEVTHAKHMLDDCRQEQTYFSPRTTIQVLHHEKQISIGRHGIFPGMPVVRHIEFASIRKHQFAIFIACILETPAHTHAGTSPCRHGEAGARPRKEREECVACSERTAAGSENRQRSNVRSILGTRYCPLLRVKSSASKTCSGAAFLHSRNRVVCAASSRCVGTVRVTNLADVSHRPRAPPSLMRPSLVI